MPTKQYYMHVQLRWWAAWVTTRPVRWIFRAIGHTPTWAYATRWEPAENVR
jgi:hypothetical protein